jgi:hypothetical protein
VQKTRLKIVRYVTEPEYNRKWQPAQKGAQMAKVTLAPEAEVAGYMVFKLGAAGVALGLGYGLVLGGSEQLSTWLVYALSVTVAGALVGSLGWMATARRRTERLDRMDDPLVPDASKPVAETKAAAPMRVSAFRPATRPAR